MSPIGSAFAGFDYLMLAAPCGRGSMIQIRVVCRLTAVLVLAAPVGAGRVGHRPGPDPRRTAARTPQRRSSR